MVNRMIKTNLRKTLNKLQGFVFAILVVPIAYFPPSPMVIDTTSPASEGIWDTPVGNPLTNEKTESVEKDKEKLFDGYLAYTVQSGDTLPAIASRFNTTVKALSAANPSLETTQTTMAVGAFIKVPKRPFVSAEIHHLLPDNLYINGTAQIGFDVDEFIQTQPGWLKTSTAFDGTASRSGAEIIKMAAIDYSVSPRLLLALIEYQSAALSQADATPEQMSYPMGYQNSRHSSIYNQVMWAARVLNEGYYNWRSGEMSYFIHQVDPRQNAASVAIQNLFARITLSSEQYELAVSEQGFSKTYTRLFGDAWQLEQSHLEENLRQPAFKLPFEIGKAWAFTGGPHTSWGGEGGQPWAALDFAPPSTQFGCVASEEWVTAVASGVIVRSGNGMVTLDLDEDGDERSGWVVMYFHIDSKDRVAAGTKVNDGDKIGHPSCEGGHATGSHVHIARLYNGEWMLAYGALAFDLEGWIAHRGNALYEGSLSRQSQVINANTNANETTIMRSEVLLASDVD